MTHAIAAVRLTPNFEVDLAQIAAFWQDCGAPQAYEALLEQIGSTVIVNLERHPRMGRRFFARSTHSVETRARVAALQGRLGAIEVREYLSGDYLLLYGLVEKGRASKPQLTVHLLAIKHHRQLPFDMQRFLQDNRGEPD